MKTNKKLLVRRDLLKKLTPGTLMGIRGGGDSSTQVLAGSTCRLTA